MVNLPAFLEREDGQTQYQTRKLSDVLQRDRWFRRRVLRNVLVTGSGSDTEVRHGLGYVPEGYLVIRQQKGGVSVFDNGMDAERIMLTSDWAGGGTVAIDILVW